MRWEQDGNTCAVHERPRPVPADPSRSRMTLANDNAEHTNWTVVAADIGLQNQRAARRVAGALDSRPAPRSASASTSADAKTKGDRTSRAESAVSHARLGRVGAAHMPG
jgi:hypothetical protein